MTEMEGLGAKELLSLIKFGADKIFSAAANRPPSDEELEALW